tara:strand:+ start:482 stop:697 length:216 start_codon:yes stop_codon:yes gene_type:complete
MKNKRHLYSRLTEDEMHAYAKWLLEECNEPIDEIMWLLHHCMAPDKEHVTIQVKQVTDNVIGSFDKNGDLI